MIKQFCSVSILLLTLACSNGGHMSLHTFNDIELGESSAEVVSTVGEPYAIRQRGDGTVEYEYIERIKAGGRDLEDRHYVITLKDGKVVSKDVKYASPAPYLFDSYEMQTSQRDQSPPPQD